MLALALLIASPAAQAWSQHYLLTDRALDTQNLAWLDETGPDFDQAGRATRTVLRLVGAQAALEP
ncbi:MAG: hypothetical protein GXP62_21380 [Oligoflexia bacterium]|nr:hypothetical protein [Oligoflexia bacterium]